MTSLTDATAMYRELQRSIPGLEGMYGLTSALVADRSSNGSRLLIVGAGGGREIEALSASIRTLDVTAVDPSAAKLQAAKQIAAARGLSDRIKFVCGTVDELPPGPTFAIATSLLVMHHLHDDGAKLSYLTALKDRLTPNATLIHADVCYEVPEELDSLIPAYLAHARHIGVADDIARVEAEAVTRLPIVSPARSSTLFVEAGFRPPRELFRSLWYRCWVSTRADSGP